MAREDAPLDLETDAPERGDALPEISALARLDQPFGARIDRPQPRELGDVLDDDDDALVPALAPRGRRACAGCVCLNAEGLS